MAARWCAARTLTGGEQRVTAVEKEGKREHGRVGANPRCKREKGRRKRCYRGEVTGDARCIATVKIERANPRCEKGKGKRGREELTVAFGVGERRRVCAAMESCGASVYAEQCGGGKVLYARDAYKMHT